MSPPRVLLIGNSHVAAPRMALRDQPERWPGFSPEIIGMPGGMLGVMELRGTELVPKDQETRKAAVFYNGRPRFELRDFDVFVILGGTAFTKLGLMVETHRSVDFPSVQRGDQCTLVSGAFVDAMTRLRIESAFGIKLLRMIESLGSAPILFSDVVLTSVEALEIGSQKDPSVALAQRGDAAALYARYLNVLHDVLGDRAQYLPQPADTIVDDVFTAAEWMRGSVKLNPHRDIPHEETDFGHANQAYGARQIDMIVEALSKL